MVLLSVLFPLDVHQLIFFNMALLYDCVGLYHHFNELLVQEFTDSSQKEMLQQFSLITVSTSSTIHFIYGTDFKMTKRIEEEILTNDIIMTHQKMSFCHKFPIFRWKSVEDQ